MRLLNKLFNAIAQRKPIMLESNYIAPSQEFSNKTALVFGGGSGIGNEIAGELKKNGANIIICGRTEINNYDYKFKKVDVSDFMNLYDNLNSLICNHIDIVVNSQGICPEDDFKGNFSQIDYDYFDKVFDVNTKSVYFITKFFAEYFSKNNIDGRILNICSTEGLKGSCVPYGMSKAATISLTKGFGKAYAQKGIIINGIAPGATATKMMKMSSDGDLRRNYIPSKRACTSTEIAKAAHFMLSDAGKQMCGQILVIDGGESLH